jgi:hypothetical protein
LWYFSSEPIEPSEYEPRFEVNPDFSKDYTQRWGRGYGIKSIIGTYSALPVTVEADELDPNGGGGGLPDVIPRKIILTIDYYQINQGYKRMVQSSIVFPAATQCYTITSMNERRIQYIAQNISQCTLSITGQVAQSNYELEVVVNSLVWLDLLNAFQFTTDVYIIFYFIVGFFSISFAAMIWIINRMLTRLRHPPPFHFNVLLYTIAQPSLIGTILGVLPTYIAITMVYNWFMPAWLGGTVCTLNPFAIPPGITFFFLMQLIYNKYSIKSILTFYFFI